VPTIVVTGGLNQQTIYRDNILDASGSFSPQGNNPLTFFWSSPDAAILNPNSPKPQIQLPVNEGDYRVFLTYRFPIRSTST